MSDAKTNLVLVALNVVLCGVIGSMIGYSCAKESEHVRTLQILTDSALSYRDIEHDLKDLQEKIGNLQGQKPEVVVRIITITDTIHGGGQGSTRNDTFYFRDDSIVEYWVNKRTDSTWYRVFPVPVGIVFAWNKNYLLAQVYNMRDSSMLAIDSVEVLMNHKQTWWKSVGIGASYDRRGMVSPMCVGGIGRGRLGLWATMDWNRIGLYGTWTWGGM